MEWERDILFIFLTDDEIPEYIFSNHNWSDKEYYIKSLDNIDQSTQIVSEFNEINTMYIIDREFLNLYNSDPIEELQYVIGIFISFAGIYYFVYEIIKKVLG